MPLGEQLCVPAVGYLVRTYRKLAEMPQAYFELLFDGVEITWDLGAAVLALEHKADISSLFDLVQSLNCSENLSALVEEHHW